MGSYDSQRTACSSIRRPGPPGLSSTPAGRGVAGAGARAGGRGRDRTAAAALARRTHRGHRQHRRAPHLRHRVRRQAAGRARDAGDGRRPPEAGHRAAHRARRARERRSQDRAGGAPEGGGAPREVQPAAPDVRGPLRGHLPRLRPGRGLPLRNLAAAGRGQGLRRGSDVRVRGQRRHRRLLSAGGQLLLAQRAQVRAHAHRHADPGGAGEHPGGRRDAGRPQDRDRRIRPRGLSRPVAARHRRPGAGRDLPALPARGEAAHRREDQRPQRPEHQGHARRRLHRGHARQAQLPLARARRRARRQGPRLEHAGLPAGEPVARRRHVVDSPGQGRVGLVERAQPQGRRLPARRQQQDLRALHRLRLAPRHRIHHPRRRVVPDRESPEVGAGDRRPGAGRLRQEEERRHHPLGDLEDVRRSVPGGARPLFDAGA